MPNYGEDRDLRSDESQREILSNQKTTEILAFLSVIEQYQPKYVCEIGTSCGGTLFLLSQVIKPDALLISIEINLPLHRALIHSKLGRPGQRVACIHADSRSPRALSQLRKVLDGNKLDLLFIDGDHSYGGVSADFENYTSYLRKGGLVALHDIVPDFRSRFGIETGNCAGDVPEFWRQLSCRYVTEQFVEDPNQDGYGIGLVHF